MKALYILMRCKFTGKSCEIHSVKLIYETIARGIKALQFAFSLDFIFSFAYFTNQNSREVPLQVHVRTTMNEFTGKLQSSEG